MNRKSSIPDAPNDKLGKPQVKPHETVDQEKLEIMLANRDFLIVWTGRGLKRAEVSRSLCAHTARASRHGHIFSTVNRGDFGQICTIFINIFIMMNSIQCST